MNKINKVVDEWIAELILNFDIPNDICDWIDKDKLQKSLRKVIEDEINNWLLEKDQSTYTGTEILEELKQRLLGEEKKHG